MQRKSIKKSVAASIKDGLAWAVMSGFAEPYAVPFVLSIGASTMAVGYLRSLPALVSSFSQFFTERLVLRLGSCKKSVLAVVFAQAASLLAMAFCVFLPAGTALPVFIFLTVLYAVSGNLANPPWAVLVGEYIPASKRGAFFGFRFQVVGVTFFTASFMAARFLSFLGEGVLWGFAALFAAAGFSRLLSFYYLTLHYESKTRFHLPQTTPFKLLSAFDFRRNRVSAMFFSVFLMLSATFLAAPYFSVYALKELHFDYMRYTVIMTIGPLMTYLFMKKWGLAADAMGSVKILKAAFFIIPTVPFLWTLSRNFYFLASVELYSGIIWGAYIIGMNNFIYDYTTPAERTGYNAAFAFVGGIAQFGGALVGGWLYDFAPPLGGSRFITLLIISGALRAAAIIPFLKLIKKENR
ncbi:MAG: MFS transporter [Elusimicrobia bacterium]|nr:MFS transporter [Elusimicrobiota bacterium]